MNNCTREEINAILMTIEAILIDKSLLVGFTDLQDYVAFTLWSVDKFGENNEL